MMDIVMMMTMMMVMKVAMLTMVMLILKIMMMAMLMKFRAIIFVVCWLTYNNELYQHIYHSVAA